MKKLVTMMMLLALVGAGVAIAADPGPETIVLENKKGAITFPHKAHQDRADGDCTVCHEGDPGKFITKKFGHGTCKDCHKKEGVSTSCKVCHSGEKSK